ERLAARGERLPAPQALLAGKAQRLDGLAERLRRGLAHRAQVAQTRLALDAGALRPALLAAHAARARTALTRCGLGARLLEAKVSAGRNRLAGLARVLPQLDPDRPLARGFARVLGLDRRLVTNAAGAARQPVLTLKFADGELAVAPAVRARRAAAAPAGQGKLF
ncbi:MAG: exodeoxyribonuclease VII large subunit, partial [Novosphingobium sp.]